MPTLTANNRDIEVSEAGWLEDCNVWDEDIARAVAQAEGIDMTPEHWDAVRAAREYFEENAVVPEQRVFMKLMKEKFGPERASQQYLFQLFPHGMLKQGNKIAGLPRPKGCS